LAKDAGHVRVDSAAADEEFLGDLAVGLANCEELENLALARRQSGVAPLEGAFCFCGGSNDRGGGSEPLVLSELATGGASGEPGVAQRRLETILGLGSDRTREREELAATAFELGVGGPEQPRRDIGKTGFHRDRRQPN